ncbi:MAG: lysophospholipid acyltransferase family protein [Gemmatimonadota bacterium]|nr:lysophospholipid acyltransferase family protein [Gemmatimonadota bacterium]
MSARVAPAGPDAGRERFAHRAEFALFRVLRGAVSVLPERLATRLAALLGTLAGSVLRIRRSDVDRHLEWAFPEKSRSERARVARASYRHLAREFVVLFRYGAWSREQLVERTRVSGLEELREATEQAGGALLLTAHLGNWEVGGAALAARGLPVEAVVKGMANRRFERALFATRARLGVRVVEMSEAPREVLRSLRSGRVVAILGDQNAHRNGIFVPFFGRAAATARGSATFALRTGVPAFLGFAVREPGWGQRYRVTVERLPFEPTGDRDRDVTAFTTAYVSAVEDAVRRHPEQYFWQHKRWKTRPPEEPPEGG